MNCPFCENKMKEGYLQGARAIIWSQEKNICRIMADPDKGDIAITEQNVSGNVVQKGANYCSECGVIIMNVKK